MVPPLAIDVAALLDEAAQLGMQVEVLGEVRDAADHALQHLLIDRGARAEVRRSPRSGTALSSCSS